MTGTIRFPSGKAVAIPMLMFFFLMMFSPFTETLIIGKSWIAFTTAFTKIGMKVSFSPSRFSKAALFLALHFTTLVTSVSMKEVTCGAICFAFTIFSAMIFLILSIGMISSPAAAVIVAAGAETGAGAETVC